MSLFFILFFLFFISPLLFSFFSFLSLPTGREDPVGVAFLRLDEAVGGHEDGPWELREVDFLVLPRPSEVADEVGVLLHARVGVGGKQLAVSVHL